jgi:hypothetical protein
MQTDCGVGTGARHFCILLICVHRRSSAVQLLRDWLVQGVRAAWRRGEADFEARPSRTSSWLTFVVPELGMSRRRRFR